MKKYKSEETTKIKPEINWDNPQWVVSKMDKNIIALTTGVHEEEIFQGVIMPCECYPSGFISKTLYKSKFEQLIGTVMFPISNED